MILKSKKGDANFHLFPSTDEMRKKTIQSEFSIRKCIRKMAKMRKKTLTLAAIVHGSLVLNSCERGANWGVRQLAIISILNLVHLYHKDINTLRKVVLFSMVGLVM